MTKLAHDGPQVSVHPGCAQGQGQRSRDMGTHGMSYSVTDGFIQAAPHGQKNNIGKRNKIPVEIFHIFCL